MNKVKLMACVPLVLLAAACEPTEGYRDKNGNYMPANPYGNERINQVSNAEYTAYPGVVPPKPARKRIITYVFDQPGYYNPEGVLVTAVQSGFEVPQNMLPPRGQCRVWLPKRNAYDQPAIESCAGIEQRVPDGAYIIYGG